MIRWKDEYNTGIRMIDEQHKRLFIIADQVYTLMKDKLATDKYDRIVAILGQLKEYTIFHFHAEEQYMKSIGYTGLAEQQAAHQGFIAKLDSVDLNKIDQDQNEYIFQLLDFVVTWIGQHIVQSDRQIAGS